MDKYQDKSYSLVELVGQEKLQQIQDTFAIATQVASTITDINGVPLTRPSNHCEVCTMIRASEKGLEYCIMSGEHLGLEAKKRMKPFHKQCLSCGFSDGAAPIIVHGKHIANWLVGQYHTRDVDEEKLKLFSREICVDENKMVDAFQKMPKISTEKFENILDFLWLMANEISELAYHNLIQRNQRLELEEAKKELEKHRDNLESLVVERTESLSRVNDKLKREIQEKDRIQREQSNLITAIENAAEAIVITDSEARIIYVNPAFEEISGYTRDEVKGKNPKILNSGLHPSGFFEEFWKTITKGEVWTGRVRNRHKSGHIYEEESTVSSVTDETGKIIHYVAVKRDVTKEVELERQLLQKNKLESIGTLAAGIAHEINTPVQFVRDNTKFLEEAIADILELQAEYEKLSKAIEGQGLLEKERRLLEDRIEEIDLKFLNEEIGLAVGQALEGLDRISSIVTAMKEFSHPGTDEKQPEDVNKIISNTKTVSMSEWKSVADLELRLAPNLPEIPVLAGQLKQVILNMIINAAHAIKERNSEKGKKGKISISTEPMDGYIQILVEDSGQGIPEDIRDKIFDPFFTTKSVGQGTGQGLSMVYSTIVEKHGGTINVESEVGCGSRFILTLPENPR